MTFLIFGSKEFECRNEIIELRKPNPHYKEEIEQVQQRIDKAYNGQRIYSVIDKIGEGTFSSVYRAIDEYTGFLDKSEFLSYSNVDTWYEPHDLDGQYIYLPKRYVAIKRIYQTSSPSRLKSEIQILDTLGGLFNCAPLIHAFRQDDQVLVVMPYFEHQEFRVYMHMMGVDDIRIYMRKLLEALSHVHCHGIVHRDIKPANFLYDVFKKKGMLVDFGLAQNEADLLDGNKYEISAAKKKKIAENKWVDEKSGKVLGFASGNKNGYFTKDPRPAFKAPRAGTRGFRAPEVLFRYPRQTVAIDVWAAGIIMLSLITKQFPVFNSQDDMDALVEIACIFGNHEMDKIAHLYGIYPVNLQKLLSKGRVWKSNIPTIPQNRIEWKTFCGRFNPKLTDTAPGEMFDLLHMLLDPDSETRITAKYALTTKFFQQ